MKSSLIVLLVFFLGGFLLVVIPGWIRARRTERESLRRFDVMVESAKLPWPKRWRS